MMPKLKFSKSRKLVSLVEFAGRPEFVLEFDRVDLARSAHGVLVVSETIDHEAARVAPSDPVPRRSPKVNHVARRKEVRRDHPTQGTKSLKRVH
jgi:hypothetical protein